MQYHKLRSILAFCTKFCILYLNIHIKIYTIIHTPSKIIIVRPKFMQREYKIIQMVIFGFCWIEGLKGWELLCSIIRFFVLQVVNVWSCCKIFWQLKEDILKKQNHTCIVGLKCVVMFLHTYEKYDEANILVF